MTKTNAAVPSDALDHDSERQPIHLRVSTAVFRGETVLLCERRENDRPMWVLPGGTPRRGEGAPSCARREVAEETGVHIDPDRVAFVLETASPDATHQLMEIVFLATVRDVSISPVGSEAHLKPEFIALDQLSAINLLPPIAGYLRGIARQTTRFDPAQATAAYLGNIWRETGSSGQAPERA